MSGSVYVDGGFKNFKSNADLSAKQYYIVKLTADDTVDLAAAATDIIVGVLYNKPKAPTNGKYDNAQVRLASAAGTTRVVAGGTINRGDFITSDANGKAVATTTTGDNVIGRALQSAVAGDIFEFMNGGGKHY